MIKREVALVILIKNNNEIFLQDRKSFSKAGEEWGFFGGGVENGETPEEALSREIMEELGLRVARSVKCLGIAENVYFNIKSGQEINVVRHVYLQAYQGEKLVVYEGDGGHWFDISEALKLKLTPGDENIFHLLTKELEHENRPT